MTEPFISVVTPFYNTAPYLPQCIESVLAQTHEQFEYILVDNCSTDGSTEIAESFARRDPRIRLVCRTQLLPQVHNYNLALDEISSSSRYFKIVQADDFIFPDCLRLMSQVLEQSDSVGLVSSYWLKGNELRGGGFPYPTPVLSGREMARLYLRTGLWVFGSPSAVMYRSSLIKRGQPFYEENRLHEDSEKCLEILEHWDFGFVHQILSFSRADNVSISSEVRGLQPIDLDRYILITRYGSVFLEPAEATALKKTAKHEYYSVLASAVLRREGPDFWRYHAIGLTTIGEHFDRPYLALQIVRRLLWNAANPGAALAKAIGILNGKKGQEKPAANLQTPSKKKAATEMGASHPANSV